MDVDGYKSTGRLKKKWMVSVKEDILIEIIVGRKGPYTLPKVVTWSQPSDQTVRRATLWIMRYQTHGRRFDPRHPQHDSTSIPLFTHLPQ